MKRNQTTAGVDEAHQRSLLLRGNLRVVGVDDEAVVTGELVGIQIVERLGVSAFDASVGERWFELFEAIGRAVMALVAEEQDADAFRGGGRFLGGQGTYGKQCEV